MGKCSSKQVEQVVTVGLDVMMDLLKKREEGDNNEDYYRELLKLMFNLHTYNKDDQERILMLVSKELNKE